MKNAIVDFERLDYEQILQEYNVQNIKDIGDWIVFSCPFSEHQRGDRKPSAGINMDSGGWNCFGCGRSGTIINFVSEYEEITLVEAAQKLQESYGALFGDYSLVEEFEEMIHVDQGGSQKVEYVKLDDSLVDLFAVDWEKAEKNWAAYSLHERLRYPFTRGITVDSLNEFSIGFDRRYKRLTIPWRDKDGHLVGFRGRATSPTDYPKYIGIGDKKTEHYGFPPPKTSHHIFGLDTAQDDLIIVEGEFDCISLRQRGFDSAVALGGSNLNDRQLELIRSSAFSVTLMFDPDQAGQKATKKWSDALIPHIPVSIANLTDDDPAESETEKLKQALSNSENALLRLI